MNRCAICGTADETCGGPSDARPIDLALTTTETTMADNDLEMVKVHVDDGTKRGHDRKFTRKDAATFMAYTPNASIVEDAPPAEDEAEAPEAPAEDKPKASSRRSVKKDDAPAEDEADKGESK